MFINIYFFSTPFLPSRVNGQRKVREGGREGERSKILNKEYLPTEKEVFEVIGHNKRFQ